MSRWLKASNQGITSIYLGNQHNLDCLRDLAKKNNVTLSSYLRSIVVDVLIEEGYDIQCSRKTGRPKKREAVEARGGPAP